MTGRELQVALQLHPRANPDLSIPWWHCVFCSGMAMDGRRAM